MLIDSILEQVSSTEIVGRGWRAGRLAGNEQRSKQGRSILILEK